MGRVVLVFFPLRGTVSRGWSFTVLLIHRQGWRTHSLGNAVADWQQRRMTPYCFDEQVEKTLATSW
jgi:hypothetical protein